jgi:hypothetical protein
MSEQRLGTIGVNITTGVKRECALFQSVSWRLVEGDVGKKVRLENQHLSSQVAAPALLPAHGKEVIGP